MQWLCRRQSVGPQQAIRTVGRHATRCIVNCAHALGQSAKAFDRLFSVAALTPMMPPGVKWIAHTRSQCNNLDGEDIVTQCLALGNNALFVGHSIGVIPAVRAAEKWFARGHHVVGVVLIAPAVDASNCVWTSAPMQRVLYTFLARLSPASWQWLIQYAEACPIFLWWISLSYVGNGWAPLDQIDHQRRGAANGLRSVHHLIHRKDISANFNKSLATLVKNGIDVVFIYDSDSGIFCDHKTCLISKDPIIPFCNIAALGTLHPLIRHSVLDAGTAGHFPQEYQPNHIVIEIQ